MDDYLLSALQPDEVSLLVRADDYAGADAVHGHPAHLLSFFHDSEFPYPARTSATMNDTPHPIE